jgi:hypothetical protein
MRFLELKREKTEGVGERERIKNIVDVLVGKQLENSMMISRKIPWTRRWKVN